MLAVQRRDAAAVVGDEPRGRLGGGSSVRSRYSSHAITVAAGLRDADAHLRAGGRQTVEHPRGVRSAGRSGDAEEDAHVLVFASETLGAGTRHPRPGSGNVTVGQPAAPA